MMPNENRPGNGAHKHGVGERMTNISESAQTFVSEARGAVEDFTSALDLRGRVERHPYATVLAAVGVGYILGGGLFTPLTGRILRLGIRLAALPFVKEELVGMAEAAVSGVAQGYGATQGGTQGDGGSTPPSV